MLKRIKKLAGRRKRRSRKNPSAGNTNRRKIQFETLEKRLLLSADPVLAGQDLQDHPELLDRKSVV